MQLATRTVEIGLAPKFSCTPTGLEVSGQMSPEEWREAGEYIGTAMRSVAFVIGDWLVAGEDMPDLFGNEQSPRAACSSELYEQAERLTGLDKSALMSYSYVARKVRRDLRNPALSWEHHRKVAKLKTEEEKAQWLAIIAAEHAAGRPVSTRRLARSLSAGRLVSREEMQESNADHGIKTMPTLIRDVVAYVRNLQDKGWLDDAHPWQLRCLARDMQPAVDLHGRILALAKERESEK